MLDAQHSVYRSNVQSPIPLALDVLQSLYDLDIDYGVWDSTLSTFLRSETHHSLLYDTDYKYRHSAVVPPHVLSTECVGSCYDTARYIYHYLFARTPHVFFVYSLFHQRDMPHAKDTHTTVVFQDESTDKYVWVEWTWRQYRGAWVYDTLYDVHTTIKETSEKSGSIIEYYNPDVDMAWLDTTSYVPYPTWHTHMRQMRQHM